MNKQSWGNAFVEMLKSSKDKIKEIMTQNPQYYDQIHKGIDKFDFTMIRAYLLYELNKIGAVINKPPLDDLKNERYSHIDFQKFENKTQIEVLIGTHNDRDTDQEKDELIVRLEQGAFAKDELFEYEDPNEYINAFEEAVTINEDNQEQQSASQKNKIK